MTAAEPEGLFLVVLLASIRRQRAKYSSSVGGFSVLGLFVLFLLVLGSTQWRSTVSSWWSSGGAEVGEFNVSRAIQERFFNGGLGWLGVNKGMIFILGGTRNRREAWKESA